jgi:hypothetical protein
MKYVPVATPRLHNRHVCIVISNNKGIIVAGLGCHVFDLLGSDAEMGNR